MIEFDVALEIVLGSARLLCPEPVDLVDSLGRILAEEIVSDIDMPPFDKSSWTAMPANWRISAIP